VDFLANVRFGERPVAVLSCDYWQSQLGGYPNVIGDTLTVNGRALEIIGVAAAGFTGVTLGVRHQIFVPITLSLGRPPFSQQASRNKVESAAENHE
jgi:hypothetical protein